MGLDYFNQDMIAYFRIDNPESLNALDVRTLQQFHTAMVDFNRNPSLRAGIVTGSGQKSFCSGINLKSTLKKESYSTIPPNLMRGLDAEKPLIAAINGSAIGGGLELALSCDIRIAAKSAIFGFPEVKFGLIPGWGGTQRLIRQISWCHAASLLFTGETIDAQTACNIGLINQTVEDDQLLNTAQKWAQSICLAAPLAVKAAKEAISKGLTLSFNEGLQLEDALCSYLKTTDDFAEGLQAFKEKRQPFFKGE